MTTFTNSTQFERVSGKLPFHLILEMFEISDKEKELIKQVIPELSKFSHTKFFLIDPDRNNVFLIVTRESIQRMEG